MNLISKYVFIKIFIDAPNVSNTILNYFDCEKNQLKRLLPIDIKEDSESAINKDSLVLSPLSQRYFLF